jgi:hypothetical protein
MVRAGDEVMVMRPPELTYCCRPGDELRVMRLLELT